MKRMSLIARAAESMADGDIINVHIRRYRKWQLSQSGSLASLAINSIEAELANEKINGYKLDRAHVFAVNMFDEIEKFMKVPDEWAPPDNFEGACDWSRYNVQQRLVQLALDFSSLVDMMVFERIKKQEETIHMLAVNVILLQTWAW